MSYIYTALPVFRIINSNQRDPHKHSLGPQSLSHANRINGFNHATFAWTGKNENNVQRIPSKVQDDDPSIINATPQMSSAPHVPYSLDPDFNLGNQDDISSALGTLALDPATADMLDIPNVQVSEDFLQRCIQQMQLQNTIDLYSANLSSNSTCDSNTNSAAPSQCDQAAFYSSDFTEGNRNQGTLRNASFSPIKEQYNSLQSPHFTKSAASKHVQNYDYVKDEYQRDWYKGSTDAIPRFESLYPTTHLPSTLNDTKYFSNQNGYSGSSRSHKETQSPTKLYPYAQNAGFSKLTDNPNSILPSSRTNGKYNKDICASDDMYDKTSGHVPMTSLSAQATAHHSRSMPEQPSSLTHQPPLDLRLTSVSGTASPQLSSPIPPRIPLPHEVI